MGGGWEVGRRGGCEQGSGGRYWSSVSVRLLQLEKSIVSFVWTFVFGYFPNESLEVKDRLDPNDHVKIY